MTTLFSQNQRVGSSFSPGPLSMLRHLAQGRTPNFSSDAFPVNGPAAPGAVGWCSYTHRGIQMLDSIRIVPKQRRYVFTDRFELRIDTAFEQVVRYCADPARDPEGMTWLGEGLVRGYVRLHEMGFAHSFEAWRGGALVGGWFGVRLGACMSCESMFHLADHAGKFAYVRSLLQLRDRGFDFVDVTFVVPHFKQWGATWVPQWKFRQMLEDARRTFPSVRPGNSAAGPLPSSVRAVLGARKLAGMIRRTLFLPRAMAAVNKVTGKCRIGRRSILPDQRIQ